MALFKTERNGKYGQKCGKVAGYKYVKCVYYIIKQHGIMCYVQIVDIMTDMMFFRVRKVACGDSALLLSSVKSLCPFFFVIQNAQTQNKRNP